MVAVASEITERVISRAESWAMLIHADDRDRLLTDLRAVLARGEHHWQDEYIVKHLVTAHGGAIELRSTEASGTEFIVRLPRSAQPLSPSGVDPTA